MRAAWARLSSACRASPGSSLERDLGAAPAAEIDGGARERVVHRHDGRAVARDAAAVAEGLVERFAERDRRVLRRVVVAGLPVAAAVDDEVEASVERELLEQVVVEAGARRDAHAAGAVEARALREARFLLSRGRDVRAVPAARLEPSSAASSRSSSSRSRTVMRMPPPVTRRRSRVRASCSASACGSATGTKTKFARDSSGA